MTNLTNVRSGDSRQRHHTPHATRHTILAQICYSLLSPDIEDDGPGDHIVCDDEELRWRTIQDVCDVILDCDTVSAPDLGRRNASLPF